MASTDRRELILARLAELLATIPGVKKVFRNRIDVPEKSRPAIVILDADENVVSNSPDGRGRPVGPPASVVEMSPDIFILLGPSSASENVGSALNALRIKVIRAVMQDDSLISLAKDGDITYAGFATGLASGRSMEAEGGIQFVFRYFMHPDRI